jgi:hypothetical protein
VFIAAISNAITRVTVLPARPAQSSVKAIDSFRPNDGSGQMALAWCAEGRGEVARDACSMCFDVGQTLGMCVDYAAVWPVTETSRTFMSWCSSLGGHAVLWRPVRYSIASLLLNNPHTPSQLHTTQLLFRDQVHRRHSPIGAPWTWREP